MRHLPLTLAEMDIDINQHNTQGETHPTTTFDENASIGTQTSESIPQKPPVTNSNLPDLKGLERLVVPSDPSTRSFIPFGIDGNLVIISPYGEVLRMSKYIAEANPRAICLNSPYSRNLGFGAGVVNRADIRYSGLGIRLMTNSKVEDLIETRLEWINGRWPYIHYEIDSVLVSVLFTVNEGVLSQQFFVENPSSESKAVRFALQIQRATVETMRLESGQWVSYGLYSAGEAPLPANSSGQYEIAEAELERSPDEPSQQGVNAESNAVKGVAVIAVFHNGKLLELDGTASVPIRSYFAPDIDGEDSDAASYSTQSKSDQNVPSASSGVLQIASKGVQKLTLQYKLQSQSEEQPRSPKYLDAEAFLKSDQSTSWSFKEDHIFNSIFRRHLEHILCLCLVDIPPDPGEERRIPFMNDVTLEVNSMPLSDL